MDLFEEWRGFFHQLLLKSRHLSLLWLILVIVEAHRLNSSTTSGLELLWACCSVSDGNAEERQTVEASVTFPQIRSNQTKPFLIKTMVKRQFTDWLILRKQRLHWDLKIKQISKRLQVPVSAEVPLTSLNIPFPLLSHRQIHLQPHSCSHHPRLDQYIRATQSSLIHHSL